MAFVGDYVSKDGFCHRILRGRKNRDRECPCFIQRMALINSKSRKATKQWTCMWDHWQWGPLSFGLFLSICPTNGFPTAIQRWELVAPVWIGTAYFLELIVSGTILTAGLIIYLADDVKDRLVLLVLCVNEFNITTRIPSRSRVRTYTKNWN